MYMSSNSATYTHTHTHPVVFEGHFFIRVEFLVELKHLLLRLLQLLLPRILHLLQRARMLILRFFLRCRDRTFQLLDRDASSSSATAAVPHAHLPPRFGFREALEKPSSNIGIALAEADLAVELLMLHARLVKHLVCACLVHARARHGIATRFHLAFQLLFYRYVPGILFDLVSGFLCGRGRHWLSHRRRTEALQSALKGNEPSVPRLEPPALQHDLVPVARMNFEATTLPLAESLNTLQAQRIQTAPSPRLVRKRQNRRGAQHVHAPLVAAVRARARNCNPALLELRLRTAPGVHLALLRVGAALGLGAFCLGLEPLLQAECFKAYLP
jgi:hypothetical protein